MNIDGSGAQELVRNIDEGSVPQFSADSQWVYYSARAANGNRVMWRVSSKGGTPQQLTQKNSSAAVLSPDGKLMLYYSLENVETAVPRIEVVPATGGEPISVFDSPRNSHDAAWAPDGKTIIYAVDDQKVSNLWAIPLEGGKPRQLTNWTAEQIFLFAWSRDGKQLAVSRGHISNDVLLIKDFR